MDYVYRLYDSANDLLYVGVSTDPKRRLAGHRRGKAWWPEVDPSRVGIEEFETRAEALAVELVAIQSEAPRYNIVGAPGVPTYDPPKCDLRADDPRHGTTNGYSNLKCRCEPCREAWAINIRDARSRRKASGVPEHVHGSPNGYGNYGCRCPLCTAAWTLDTQDRRHRRERGETLVALGIRPAPKLRRPSSDKAHTPLAIS